MTKRNQDFSKDILSLIRSSVSPAVLSERLQDFHENDLAEVLRELSTAERSRLYRILESSMLADVFEYLEEEETVQYLEEMDVKKAAAILSKMETDALADVLKQIDKEKRKLLIQLLDEQVRKDIEMIRSFDEDEIGSRMTTNCIVIRENLTVKQAMSELVSQAADNDNISTIFAVTDRGEFYGALDLKDLITARQDHPMEELIVTSYPYVYGTEQIDDCMERLKDYSEDSIPVLDDDNRFLGVITSAGIIDLVDDEMGEDYAKLAGLTAEEDLKEPLFESMKKRMPWLIVLLGLGMVVSSVVGMFEKVVTCLPIIMCFQSLILDMAGNVGTQSLAVTDGQTEIRACAEGNADRPLQRWSARNSVFCTDRIVYFLIQRKNSRICLCGIRLYRIIPAGGHAGIQCSGNLHTAVFQKGWCGPGSSLRSSDPYDE